jgi:phosphopantetheinyl transferase
VSLAHDEGLAVAACARAPVGIDVVYLGRASQLTRVVRSVLEEHPDRAPSIAGVLPWPAAVVAWTAWEALGKLSGVGVLGLSLTDGLEVNVAEGGAVGAAGGSRLRWWAEGQHVFCLAVTA